MNVRRLRAELCVISRGRPSRRHVDSMAEPEELGDCVPAEVSATADAAEKPEALSCLTLPSFSDACGFIGSRYSCLVVKTHRRHLALSPKYLNKKRSGIKEHLSAELLKYSVRLEGVPVAYDNIKLVGELGDIYDDIGYIHLNIEADFVIFQPKCGQRLVGVVNKKAPSHIGCLVHGCFNASIPRPPKMPVAAWQHMEVNIGDQLEFEVFRLDSDAVGVFCIRGRLDKTMEAEAIEKLNAMSEEQNANVPHDEVQNGPETAEEGTVGETSMFSEATSRNKCKKRKFEETLSQNEDTENKEDANVSLEEAPKKKRKKHKRQKPLSQEFVEVDESGEIFSTLETSLKHQDSLQNFDNGLEVDRSVVELDSTSVVPSSQEHKVKRSKKKKRKDHSDLESSLHDGLTEDSMITEDSTLKESETEPGTTKKKHKEKHNASLTLSQSLAPVLSQETTTDNSIIQQETPKTKKHKKKRQDPSELESENRVFQTKDDTKDNSKLGAGGHKAKKRRKE